LIRLTSIDPPGPVGVGDGLGEPVEHGLALGDGLGEGDASCDFLRVTVVCRPLLDSVVQGGSLGDSEGAVLGMGDDEKNGVGDAFGVGAYGSGVASPKPGTE
jgi:hypothetical protein